MTTGDEQALLAAAEQALARWAAFRLYPEQGYAEMCEAMRMLEEACEGYDETESA